jgi:hypothetical protein
LLLLDRGWGEEDIGYLSGSGTREDGHASGC